MIWRKLLLLTLSVLTFSFYSFGQSLAEAARKERERQKTAQSKVIIAGTGKSAATSKPAATAPPSTTPSKPPSTSPAPETTTQTVKPVVVTDNKGRTEQYWRATFQQARDDAQRAAARVELLDLKLKELNTSLLRQTDVYNRENRIGPEITATQKELDEARKAADQAKKNIAALEEELRRSAGPAGWAR